MKRGAWKNRIVKACKEAGTYEPFFDHTIKVLAEILEKRDEAEQQYQQLDAMPVIKHTNKAGATNVVKNPALVMWDDLNKSALAYWRDLGLTPAGLKKIRGEAGEQKKSPLAAALDEITKELQMDEQQEPERGI